jgi:hypothetical protein
MNRRLAGVEEWRADRSMGLDGRVISSFRDCLRVLVLTRGALEEGCPMGVDDFDGGGGAGR